MTNYKLRITPMSRGFTLIELLMYMGILALLLIMLTNVFTEILDTQLTSQANTSVEQDGNYILSKLSYDVYRASSITTPSSLGSTSTTMQLVIDGVVNTYTVNGDGNLVVTNALGTNNLNGYETRVSDFVVQRLGNAGKIENTAVVTFALTSRTEKRSGYQTQQFQTAFSLRRQ